MPLKFIVHVFRVHPEKKQFESDEKTDSQLVSRLVISRQQIEKGTAEVNVSHEDIFSVCTFTHFQSKHLLFFQSNQTDQMLLFPFLRAL